MAGEKSTYTEEHIKKREENKRQRRLVKGICSSHQVTSMLEKLDGGVEKRDLFRYEMLPSAIRCLKNLAIFSLL